MYGHILEDMRIYTVRICGVWERIGFGSLRVRHLRFGGFRVRF